MKPPQSYPFRSIYWVIPISVTNCPRVRTKITPYDTHQPTLMSPRYSNVTTGIHELIIWYMFWHSTRGFPQWHWGNLCIWVDARFHYLFSDRNFGVLLEVLCVGLNIMNLKLFDSYQIINSRILLVTLEYLGDIRVGWCVSYGVILVRTLGLFVTLIGMAQ